MWSTNIITGLTAGTPVLGCTDPTATNYNPSANLNDGSCTYGGGGGSADSYFSMVESTSLRTLSTLVKTRVQDLYDWMDTEGIRTSCVGLWPCLDQIENTMNINAMTLTRGIFVGGNTFNPNGVKPNGSTGYFRTGVNLKTIMGTNKNCTLCLYTRTDNTTVAIDMGAEETAATSQAVLSAKGTGGAVGRIGNSSLQANESAYDHSQGLTVITRNSPTDLSLYRDGSLIITTTTSNSTNVPDKEIYIGAYNNNGSAALFSDRQWCFAAIFVVGLSATQIFNLNIKVEGIQDALTRGVQ